MIKLEDGMLGFKKRLKMLIREFLVVSGRGRDKGKGKDCK